MPESAISKVIFKASSSATPEVWMDSTTATAAAEDITAPKTAMLADGVMTTGTGTGGGGGMSVYQDEDGYIVLPTEGGGSDLTDAAKRAILACFQNAAWIDDDGQDYYDALYAAFYGQSQPYEFYDYLQGDGTAFIDTGLDARVYGADTYERIIKFKWTSFAASDYPYIVGARNTDSGDTGFYVCGETNANNLTWYVSLCGGYQTYTATTRNDFIEVKTKDKKIYIDGDLVYTGTNNTPTINSAMNIPLFTLAKPSSASGIAYNGYYVALPCPSKLYEFTVNDANGDPVAHMVPAKRKSDNEYGLYDTVRDEFYTNANSTGAFIAGNDA